MKLQNAEKTNSQQPAVLSAKNISQLRKQAESSGIPVFAWRIAAAQKMSLVQSETTVRHRHD